MLINELKADVILQQHICNECRERGFGVIIHNDISKDDILIIKVDSYYNNLNIAQRPASPDCLIIQRCANGQFSIFIVELKDISDAQGGFEIKNIRQKFETCIYDFMCGVLRKFFYDTSYSFKNIRLWFITDPYKENLKGNRERLNKPTKLDFLMAMNTKPFIFDNKRLVIEHFINDPPIVPC